LFDENIAGNYTPTALGWDGSGKHAIDTVSAGWIDMTAVSGDGTLVAYTTDALLVSKADSPQRVTGPAIAQGQSWARFARDPADATKWRIYFLVDRAWGSPTHERGIYSVAPDGTGLVTLMTPAQAAATIGNGVTADAIAPKAMRYGLDVSADGKA